jgi:hypothetical protein
MAPLMEPVTKSGHLSSVMKSGRLFQRQFQKWYKTKIHKL